MGSMGSASGKIGRWAAITALALVVGVAAADADVTTERSASILIFPKVVFDSSGLQTGTPVDTIIQISNTSNSMVFAHCFYVNAVPPDPTHPPGPTNPPIWQEVDFEIFLTKQQPTHWLLSSGRLDDPGDNKSCSADCSGAGFDPGRIPPAGNDPFTGELKCIEVDSSGAPINGNHLKGEATIVTTDGRAEVSAYNAVGVLGLNTDLSSNNSDTTLCLGCGVCIGGPRAGARCAPAAPCPDGYCSVEYNACPQTVILNHFAEGATDPVIEALGNGDDGKSNVSTELTLVPCSEDFENQVPPSVVVQFLITNEFEAQFSTSTTVTCWGNFRLNRIGSIGRILEIGTLGTRFAQTRMSPASDDQPGFVGVVEEFHTQPTASAAITSRAALNLHTEGARPMGDVILLPGAF
jgi:hypothetical protein